MTNKTKTKEFIDYCMQFYGKNGLYPIKGITAKMIKDAICELALTGHPFCNGDSRDREEVRNVITKQLGLD